MESKMNDIPVKVSSMGVVFVKKNVNEPLILILNCAGEWVFPKGHIEKGETLVDTACREIKEESGVIVNKVEPP